MIPSTASTNAVQIRAIQDLAARDDRAQLTWLMHRTLIVDDSPTMRRMVMASLREVCTGGFVEAASGLEAIEQLALGPTSLMVLDLNMPDMHGLEVLRFVRSHHTYRHLPVMILTTRGDETSRGAALAAGATLYQTKPFAPHVLAAQVRSMLDTDQQAGGAA